MRGSFVENFCVACGDFAGALSAGIRRSCRAATAFVGIASGNVCRVGHGLYLGYVSCQCVMGDDG